MKSQAEKSRPQREFFHQILTDLRQEVKEFNRTAKSGKFLKPYFIWILNSKVAIAHLPAVLS